MRKITLTLLAAVIVAGLLSVLVVKPGFAQDPGQKANVQLLAFNVSPGEQLVIFDTAGTPPLLNLRFFFGGPPDLRILLIIAATSRTPAFDFVGATPSDATAFFATNPTFSGNDSVFFMTVANLSTSSPRLTIGATWDEQ